MSISILSHSTRILSVLVFVATFCSPAFAASPCKGVAQNACSVADQCVWVKGYTRKDGRSVSSYCKLRSRKKPDQSAGAAGNKLSAVAR